VEGNSRAPNESRLEQESTNDETHDSYRIDGSEKNNREKGEKNNKREVAALGVERATCVGDEAVDLGAEERFPPGRPRHIRRRRRGCFHSPGATGDVGLLVGPRRQTGEKTTTTRSRRRP
jgi:hypothetical protein